MWKIVYTIGKHYKNDGDHIASYYSDLEEVTGDTYEDVIETLITKLKKTPVLKHIIDTYALKLYKHAECYYDITIKSAIEITDSKNVNFRDILEIKKLIKERKELKAEKKIKIDRTKFKKEFRRFLDKQIENFPGWYR